MSVHLITTTSFLQKGSDQLATPLSISEPSLFYFSIRYELVVSCLWLCLSIIFRSYGYQGTDIIQ